nr:glycosyltransferase family 8 protein [uncultured Bacteroides sp.]
MDIACNIDNCYVKYCIVMLVSLFENNEREEFNVYVVSDNLSEENKLLMTDSLERYKNNLCFCNVGNDILRDCPINPDSYISISTYYRLFLPLILPVEVSKVLYLDCDLVVMSSIKALWDIDLTNNALGVVEDMWSFPLDYPYEAHERLGYAHEYSYFNAGVMLINLDYWRAHNILGKCVEYIKKYPERLVLNDQDVLNAVLYDQKLFISFIWNMQEGFYRRKRKVRWETWVELDSLLATPSILHYNGEIKPWHKDSFHPLTKEWFVYLDKTKWKGERPAVSLWDSLCRLMKSAGYFLRIDKPIYRKNLLKK